MSYDKLIQDPAVYMRQLFESGWLDEWCEEDIEQLQKTLMRNIEKDPKHTVFTLSEYSIDPEGVCTDGAYKTVLYDMLSAFEVDIDEVDISVENDEERFTLSVKTPDGMVSWDFEQEDDWLHDDFIDFLNDELLPAFGEERVLHPLPPASATIDLVFHYPDVIEKAIELGIIPADDYFC